MKKFIIFFFSILLALPSYNVEAQTDDAILIIFIRKDKGRLSRSIDEDIHCYYIRASQEICFEFSDDFGQADITVSNVITGESEYANINTATGYASVYIPQAPGYYSIRIKCSNGDSYQAEAYLE